MKRRHALCVCSSSSTQTADSHRVHARVEEEGSGGGRGGGGACHCVHSVHSVHYATSSYNTLHIQQPYSLHTQALTFGRTLAGGGQVRSLPSSKQSTCGRPYLPPKVRRLHSTTRNGSPKPNTRPESKTPHSLSEDPQDRARESRGRSYPNQHPDASSPGSRPWRSRSDLLHQPR